MAENAEDIICKQQVVLDTFFTYLGNFSYDKAKEYLEKERDIAVKNHSVAPFFSSALSVFALLAAAEKNYANFMFLSKGFLRWDTSRKSMYEGLLEEYLRLEKKNHITPVHTPTLSPSTSYRTPSPPSNLLPPSPVSASSEVSVSTGSSSSARTSTQSFQTYFGEDILENLSSHLGGQLVHFVRARLKTIEFYERMYSMSSTRFIKFELLFNNITEIVKHNSKLFHHPMLSPLKSSFSCECEILMKLLDAQIQMQNWRFLPSLLCLHEAHSKLIAWLSFPKEIKRLTGSSSYKPPSPPLLYTWLKSLKSALVSKFSLYFHEILSKQAPPTEMKNFCSKATVDYFSKIITFQKRYDVACVAIVLDTNGLEEYAGHGYKYPSNQWEAPKGLDSFPPIISYPPNCFSQEKHSLHWPSVVMIMNNKEQEIKNTESAVSVYDRRINATYFMSKIESRMTLVVIFESKKTDRDTHIHKFMQLLCTQLRGNKLFSSLKHGSK